MYSFLISIVVLVLGYIFYGKLIDRIFGPDPSRITPAVSKADGVDYVPMPTWKVFMVQFLNIAGTGPIFGAIMGAEFGPSCYIWIVLGSIFAGAVHDYLSGMVSLRNDGCALPEIIGRYLGRGTRVVVLVFVVFLMMMVGTVFVYSPAQILGGMTGGGSTVIMIWAVAIFIYYILATLVPIDKIVGRIYPIFAFALLFMAVALMVCLFVKWPQLPEFWDGLSNRHPSQSLFPCLFITVACGAISGFHATQSPLMARCLKSEKLGRPVFYGAMITEGLVALIWAAVSSYFFYGGGAEALGAAVNSSAPQIVNIVSRNWLGLVGGILAILGVVAAPITSGDTAFRSARLIIADGFHIDQKPKLKRLLVALPLFVGAGLLLWFNVANADGFNVIWRYFGLANQSLACFTLWALTVFLLRERKGLSYLLALVPAVFMTSVCVTYLLTVSMGFLHLAGYEIPVALAVALISLLLFLVYLFIHKKRSAKAAGLLSLVAGLMLVPAASGLQDCAAGNKTRISAAEDNQVDAKAKRLEITSFRYAGPYVLNTPYLLDSVSVEGKAFDMKSLLSTTLSHDALRDAAFVDKAPQSSADALHLIGFTLENKLFVKAELKVEGLEDWQLYQDGLEVSAKGLKLEPGTHEMVLRYFGKGSCADSLKLAVESPEISKLSLREDGKRIFSLDLNTIGVGSGGASISAGGRYIALGRSTVLPDGKSSSSWELLSSRDGSLCARLDSAPRWMPKGDRCWFTRKEADGRCLCTLDPDSGVESVLARNIPEGWFSFSPDGKYLIYSLEKKGPKEGEVHQILSPEDRQPGWRDRSYLARYDLASGLLQPLTFGWHNAWLCDISSDGRKLLFMSSRERLTQRPTTLHSFYVMDMETLETECVVEGDGFLNSGSFSPDGSSLLFTGTPEAFGGIGSRVKEGQIPNGFDIQLFRMELSDRSVKPLTADFNPSVSDAQWNAADGMIYALTEDKDCRRIYRIDPSDGKAEALNVPEDYVKAFDLSESSPLLVCTAQSLGNGDRAYCVDLRKGRLRLLRDYSAERLERVVLDEGHAFEFTSSRGDLINCFYVLPPDFDPQRSYPMLVHYYGGCSPTSRYCIGSYSPQYYAAQGYIFLVVNPSGAAGFGQEFAARHVNTAGDVVSDDIIEATERFCDAHPYVNRAKIGCFSASYGGFMTQLLLSKTDIYAAGISHAGISDHSSYWGEGYWGYSYSEVSMAGSYPWTRKDLFVDRSPLYNADKIHTPLLFLHGSADTNVPIGESIQMFTALKILGEDTAFVVVDGEDHGIREFGKRRQWLRTISAWFAKYLQDDSSWWDELYPPKQL